MQLRVAPLQPTNFACDTESVMQLLALASVSALAFSAPPPATVQCGRRSVVRACAVDVSDLSLTMEDLEKPLDVLRGITSAGIESTSRTAKDEGLEWSETATQIEAKLAIPGLRGQPAAALALEMTETTATVTAFGRDVWSCVLRGTVDPSTARAAVSDSEGGMQPVVQLQVSKAAPGRWSGFVESYGVDSIL